MRLIHCMNPSATFLFLYWPGTFFIFCSGFVPARIPRVRFLIKKAKRHSLICNRYTGMHKHSPLFSAAMVSHPLIAFLFPNPTDVVSWTAGIHSASACFIFLRLLWIHCPVIHPRPDTSVLRKKRCAAFAELPDPAAVQVDLSGAAANASIILKKRVFKRGSRNIASTNSVS